ncbi:MAG: hypothetical protein KA216_06145 [Giesbergeria sp.]|nr:hypothetical protein [Giesbergeria sp.]
MSDTASASAPSAQRTAWLLFAPPAALVALRWLLQWQADRSAQTPLLPLTPFTPPTEVFSVLAPFLWGLLVLLGAAFGVRWAAQRWGWLPVQRVALVLWLGLCMAGAFGVLQRHHNLQGTQSLTPVSAEVLGSRFTPPSLRGTGGTQLIVRVAGLELPQQVLIDDPQAAHWQPGQRLLLHWARGARSGYFVTGWLALAPPLAASSSVQAGVLWE